MSYLQNPPDHVIYKSTICLYRKGHVDRHGPFPQQVMGDPIVSNQIAETCGD